MNPRIFLCLVALIAKPVHAEVLFDRFLIDAERCERDKKTEFNAFRDDVINRYRNDFGTKSAKVNYDIKIRIPTDVAGGVGRAKSINFEGKWTKITVPLQGIWRGLSLRAIEFRSGNENGLWTWIFRFEQPLGEVIREFGRDVEKANRAIRGNPDNMEFGSAKIGKDLNGIVCDWST